MAATITPLLTKFTGATSTTSDCEAATDWSGSPVLDTINNLENLGCLSKKVSNTALAFVYTLVSSFDLTAAGHTHIYVWMMVTTVGKLATKANGGMRIRVEDASANFAEWYVGGKDTYAGGWKNFAIDTTKTPDNKSATGPTMTAVTKVGVAFLMGVSVTGNVTNCFWDVMRQGSGLQITGGTSGTPGTFQDILDAEAVSTNFYGILRKEGGVLFCSGELIFGDASGTTSTYFTDVGQVLVFEDKLVNSGLYKIKTQGNATGTTEIKFGTKIGTGETAVGNAGITFRSANKAATPFQIDCLQSNVGVWGFYGCIFQNGGLTKFDKVSTNTAELISCSWNNMDQAQVADSFVRNCTFSGYTPDTIGALLWNSSIDIKKCAFNANTDATNNPAAIEHSAQGTFTYTDLTFSGNDYDINYTAAASSGVLTINATGTSNPGTSKILNATGNSVTMLNAKNLTLTVKDSLGANIQTARSFIRKSDQVAMGGALAYTGSYVDETTAANNATTNDMTLLRASPATNDAYYFGGVNPFWKLTLNISTAGVGTWTITWQYWNGAWTTIPAAGFSDGTNAFQASAGSRDVVFTPPSDWVSSTVSSVAAYWIRANLTFTSLTTQPKGTQSWVWEQLMNTTTNGSGIATTTYNYLGDVAVTYDVRKSSTGATKYIPVEGTGTITSSGFSATVTMTTDNIAEA